MNGGRERKLISRVERTFSYLGLVIGRKIMSVLASAITGLSPRGRNDHHGKGLLSPCKKLVHYLFCLNLFPTTLSPSSLGAGHIIPRAMFCSELIWASQRPGESAGICNKALSISLSLSPSPYLCINNKTVSILNKPTSDHKTRSP